MARTTVKPFVKTKSADPAMEPHEILIKAFTTLKKGERVAVFLQDNPDPDAIGSALGFQFFVRKVNPQIQVELFHGAEISHPQNRTMVNLLNVPLRRVDGRKDYSDYAYRVFVDVASSGKKNLQSCNVRPDVIIDHHEDDPEGEYLLKDIRSMGATATMVCDYIRKAGFSFNLEIEEDLQAATALFFGIENDTWNLVAENTKQLDIDCFLHLLPLVDIPTLTSIRNYPIPRYFFELEEIANRYKRIEGSALITGLEFLKPDRRDSIPFIADKFLRMEGIETVVVLGIVEDHLVASLRTTNSSISLNSICHSVFGESYSGAKQGSGGARVPLGLMAPTKAGDNVKQLLWDALWTKMSMELFDKISGH